MNSIDWDYILNTFSEIKQLEQVPQDKIYHAEGDVLTHTKMVCEELVNMKEFKKLERSEKEILFLAALFHDIGKAVTTKEEDGRIISPNHAVRGAMIVRSLFYKKYGECIVCRECVVNLIRYHGLPIFFWDKDNPSKYLFEASWNSNLYHLYLLAKADCLGRIGEDKENLISYVEMFREFAYENNCLYHVREFPNDLSRFEYFRKDYRDINFEAYDESLCTVILLCGLPAVGKDTWISTYYGDGFSTISLDNIREVLNISPNDNQGRVIQEAKEQAKIYLRQHKSFIWNATNITKKIRTNLTDLFIDYKAKVIIAYIEIPYKELIKRNEKRKRVVPISVINHMIDKLEVPSITEAHEINYFYDSL